MKNLMRGVVGAMEPCPHCTVATALEYFYSGSQGVIECKACGTLGPCDEMAADPHCLAKPAFVAWNRRAHVPGGCPFCGSLDNLHIEGENGERTHCGDCDAMWPTSPNGKLHW